MKICPNCHNSCDDNSSVCPTCNSFLAPNTDAPQNPTPMANFSQQENTSPTPIPQPSGFENQNPQNSQYAQPVQPQQPNYQQSQQNFSQQQYQQPQQPTYYQQPMPRPPKKGLPGWGIALIVVGAVILVGTIIIISLAALFYNVGKDIESNFNSDYDYSYNYDSDYSDGNNSNESTEAPANASVGTPFNFGTLEITIGDKYEFATVDNQFSDQNGKTVVKIPVNVKNNGTEDDMLNMFFVTTYGANGVKTDTVTWLFKDGADIYDSLQPGASTSGYLYVLYDSDGDYTIKLSDFSDKVSVTYPVKK